MSDITGWTAVQRDVMINFDLENSPLQITTKNEVGSDEVVTVWFYTAGGERAGGFYFYFKSSPLYWLGRCSTSWTSFPTELPPDAAAEKVWTVTLLRISGSRRVVINCDQKEVLNVVLSETTCSKDYQGIWNRDVEMIIFLSSLDTASDYYRRGKIAYICLFV